MDIQQNDFFWTDNYTNILDIDVNDLIPDMPDNFLNLIDTSELMSSSLSPSPSSFTSSSPQTSPALSISPSPPLSFSPLCFNQAADPLPCFPSNTPYSDATKCKKKSTDGHVKRPMNPFMIFAQRERMIQCMSTSSPPHNALISKLCGLRWRAMSAEEKRPFKEAAAKLKLLHKQEFPEYKYKPKKKTDAAPKPIKKPVLKSAAKKVKTNIPNKDQIETMEIQKPASLASPNLLKQPIMPTETITLSPIISADTSNHISYNHNMPAKTSLSPITEIFSPSGHIVQDFDSEINQHIINIKEECADTYDTYQENDELEMVNNFVNQQLLQNEEQQIFQLQSSLPATTMFIFLEQQTPLKIET